mgnify:CR=1 FL=1
MAQENKIEKDKDIDIVCILTGNGLKDTSVVVNEETEKQIRFFKPDIQSSKSYDTYLISARTTIP